TLFRRHVCPTRVPSHVSAAFCRSPFSLTAPATTELYTLSLHDALPISRGRRRRRLRDRRARPGARHRRAARDHRAALPGVRPGRSEEHTSELQSRENLVCRLLLEKKKKDGAQQLRREDATTRARKQLSH